MVTISNYAVLTDQTVFTFSSDDATWKINFDLPKDVVTTEDKHRPVLCYNVDGDGAENLGLRVSILGSATEREISESHWNGNLTHQVMDPFPQNWLTKGANAIRFQRTSGTGSAQVRNVILFFTRRVLT